MCGPIEFQATEAKSYIKVNDILVVKFYRHFREMYAIKEEL